MQYIYLLKNKVTGRGYVGRTCQPKNRLKLHMNNLKANRHPNELMQEDFNLYGVDSFEFEILAEYEQLTRTGIEKQWILKLKTHLKQFGYNYKDPCVCKKGNTGNKPKGPVKQSALLNNIRRLSKEKHISINRIEKECGLSCGAISHWNKVNPCCTTLFKVAGVLGVTFEELLKDTGTPTQKE